MGPSTPTARIKQFDPRRNTTMFWLLSAALAVLTAGVVHRQLAAADRAVQAFGTRHEVVRFTTDLHMGSLIAPGDVEVDQVPLALLPRSPVVDDPVGRTVTAAVLAGEIAVEARLAPDGLFGLAALIPPASRAVTVPTDVDLLVQPGHRVDLISAGDTYERGRVVTDMALVIDRGEDSITVAVPQDDVPDLIDALARGLVVPALVGSE